MRHRLAALVRSTPLLLGGVLGGVLAAAGCGERRGTVAARADTTAAPAASATAAARDSTVSREAAVMLADSGVGCLRIGAPVAEVRRACHVVREATRRGAEGTPERRLVAAVGPDSLADTVAATIVGDSVWRLEVTRASWLTADSVGVGTPLRRLLAEPGARALTGEGNLAVMIPRHCGLSFQLATPPGEATTGDAEAAVHRLPAATPVRRVLVIGCHRRT